MTTDADRELAKKIAAQAREIAMRDERSLSVVAAELGLAAGRAEERERAARLAEDIRVSRAMPPFDDVKPKSGDGWRELWDHVGCRIAAAIRKEPDHA